MEDSEMSNALRPSLEDAMSVINEDDALDFIAKRGAASSYVRERRIQWG